MSLSSILTPYILAETDTYGVVYKPPFLHSAPLKPGGEDTLLDWYARRFPRVRSIHFKQEREGGILHRLDYETAGLVLFAKTQEAMDSLAAQQNKGLFVKEYEALSVCSGTPGQPCAPVPLPAFPPVKAALSAVSHVPAIIESGFRAYGPGRRAVRPVEWPLPGRGGRRAKTIALDQGRPYATEILEIRSPKTQGAEIRFSLRINRGFRHQIRCHLAWIGYPILNDAIYGGKILPAAQLALLARKISFLDPLSQEPRLYSIPGNFSLSCNSAAR